MTGFNQQLKTQWILIGLLLSLGTVNAQQLTEPSLKLLKKQRIKIGVTKNYTTGNWSPINKYVKNKRIVLIGEPNHGSKQIFEARNDLIKHLHKNLGFNTILFESGIGELIRVDIEKEQLSSAQMTSGFFGGWRTQEFAKLMDYVKNHQLNVNGFDIQRTGGNFKKVLETEANKLKIDSTLFSGLEKRFGIQKRELANRKVNYKTVKPATNRLIEDYRNLLTAFNSKQGAQPNQSILLVKQTLHNRINYLKYFLDFAQNKDWNNRWKARDANMASNVDWLLENLYKNEKVIIIAHNFHISKHNEKEEVMGEFLKENYGTEMYVLGVFAGKGSFHDNSGKEKQLTSIDRKSLDIKQVIQSLDGRLNFINMPKKQNSRNAWLFNKIIVNDTFIDLSRSNELILSKHFDGLLFIDQISPPEKL